MSDTKYERHAFGTSESIFGTYKISQKIQLFLPVRYYIVLLVYELNINMKLTYIYYCVQGLHEGICKPFVVAGHQVGLIRPDVMKHLHRFPEVNNFRRCA